MCPCPLRSDDNAPAGDSSVNAAPPSGSVSSIPSKTGFWTYPSPSRFLSSVENKGHVVNPKDIPSAVSVHNAVNDVTWQKIMGWEKSAETCNTRFLEKFYGDSKYGSMKSKVFGYVKGWTDPFDTHVWVVNRCGKSVKYLIDFYNGSAANIDASSKMPVSVFVDVRPKVEDWGSFVEYCKLQLGRFS